MTDKVNRHVKRKLRRAREICERNKVKYDGKERDFTFHGGFDSGYYKGIVSTLEDIADALGIDLNEFDSKDTPPDFE